MGSPWDLLWDLLVTLTPSRRGLPPLSCWSPRVPWSDRALPRTPVPSPTAAEQPRCQHLPYAVPCTHSREAEEEEEEEERRQSRTALEKK